MEFNLVIDRPLVRIGVLRGETKMIFSAYGPFKAYDLGGNFLASGAADKQYEVEVVGSEPASLMPAIRLAIRSEKSDAEGIAERWDKFGLNIEILHPGQDIRTGNKEFRDNREYWVLAKGFDSIGDADRTRRELPDFGSFGVISVPWQQAKGSITWNGYTCENGIRLIPEETRPANFSLENVRVGIGFHWDHRESQDYEGELEFRIDPGGTLTAINVLDIERYLASVNSSEMVPDCSLSFLKAQTVVARSTVFATAGKHHFGEPFDLCADDHCQCFHGAGAIEDRSLQAANETRGLVLTHEGLVCDTRYAKVCAGIGEKYSNVWDDREIAYLDKFYDSPNGAAKWQPADDEENGRAFIESSPEVFCNPTVYPVPKHLEYAHDYFRWQVKYKAEELGAIVAKKANQDLGPIREILPVKRGFSGRLIYAKIVGDSGEIVVGKELEIRRVLSESHLFSSCFFVEKEVDKKNRTNQIILHGAGWGHGVGICQVGAAVMGESGYPFNAILKHYYQSSELEEIYY